MLGCWRCLSLCPLVFLLLCVAWRGFCMALMASLCYGFAATAPPAASSVRAPGELRSRDALREGIGRFYDESSGVWETVWGEHMHHGFYADDRKKDHVQAQVDMVDETLRWAGVDAAAPPTRILDVGCGIGGSSRHLARKYGCSGVGITLSPVQARRAQQLSDEQGLPLEFQVADALGMPFEDDAFDLVWSMESGEHMPDKAQFVRELARVCKPGGRVILVAWCHRDLADAERALRPLEEGLLRVISAAYYLPRWSSVADYSRHARAAGLSVVRTDDWTEKVRRFWPAVIGSALRPRNFVRMLRAGGSTVRGALVMPLMILGQKLGLIRFGMLVLTKPLSPPLSPQPSPPPSSPASSPLASPAPSSPRTPAGAKAWVAAATSAIAGSKPQATSKAKPQVAAELGEVQVASTERQLQSSAGMLVAEPAAKLAEGEVRAAAAARAEVLPLPPTGFDWGCTLHADGRFECD